MSVHHPHPEHREALIASMHRYGAAIAGKPGLVSVHTLADADSPRLVGLAIFESEADFERLAPLARAAGEVVGDRLTHGACLQFRPAAAEAVGAVGATGLEPAISCSQSRRASHYATPRIPAAVYGRLVTPPS